ncbi:MAG: hypothetical protein R3D99_06930 [Altererythrobacter sp.]
MVDTVSGGIGQFRELGIAMRQEFMQRRVEQADRAWQASHDLEYLLEVTALFGKQLFKRRAARLLVFGKGSSRARR